MLSGSKRSPRQQQPFNIPSGMHILPLIGVVYIRDLWPDVGHLTPF